MNKKIEHLKMIQGIVNRLANCSFLLKGWSVVIVSALFALASKDSHTLFILVALLPAIAFWVLDGYFLWQERLYRKLYDAIRKMPDSDETDFSMNISPFFSEVDSWQKVIISKTLLIYHGAILITILIALIITSIIS